jgi:hypothetical protein
MAAGSSWSKNVSSYTLLKVLNVKIFLDLIVYAKTKL